jgi:hypothetical protein
MELGVLFVFSSKRLTQEVEGVALDSVWDAWYEHH